jgi:dTDP-4-dehydrorhamnose reductase
VAIEVLNRKVLVIGADGFIGGHLCKELARNCNRAFATVRVPRGQEKAVFFFELGDRAVTENLARKDFSVVVVCSGITGIQRCEENRAETWKVNVSETISTISVFLATGKHVIFLSTNMVYGEAMACDQSNQLVASTEYAKQKAEVELFLSQARGSWTVVRLSKVIGPRFALFDEWCDRFRRAHIVKPYSDKLMSPVSIELVCNVIRAVIARRTLGIIEIYADRNISYADAALHLANQMDFDLRLISPTISGAAAKNVVNTKSRASDDLLRALGFKSPSPFDAIDFYISELRARTSMSSATQYHG